MIKRLFDFFLACLLSIILSVLILTVASMVALTSKGSVLYWTERVGRNNALFKMPKFRSMYVDTPEVATHLLKNASQYLTPIGSFLRKSSLDELPQLWSILKGDMSFVGPRPALFNQYDLIELRSNYGVDKIPPGLTGWAQINGRDELKIQEKALLDFYYIKHQSFMLDLKIIYITILKVICKDGIKH